MFRCLFRLDEAMIRLEVVRPDWYLVNRIRDYKFLRPSWEVLLVIQHHTRYPQSSEVEQIEI